MVILFIVVGAVIASLIAWLNLWDHRRRAAMTPAEREADDEETRRAMAIW